MIGLQKLAVYLAILENSHVLDPKSAFSMSKGQIVHAVGSGFWGIFSPLFAEVPFLGLNDWILSEKISGHPKST